MKSLVLGFFLGIVGLFFGAELPDAETFLQHFKEKFGVVKTIRCDFIQTREIPALEMKLVFTGRMAYDAQARRFLWRVETPMPCAFRLQNDEFAQWDGETGKVFSISAAKLPWIKTLQEHLGQWLSGDLSALRKEADVKVLSQYRVRLIPRDGLLATLANAVELEFSEDYERVAEIRMEEKSGDVLTIQFQNTLLNQPIPEATWQW